LRKKNKLYEKNEFCKAMKCIFFDGNCKSKPVCIYTARQFHHWLQDNNFSIIKEKGSIPDKPTKYTFTELPCPTDARKIMMNRLEAEAIKQKIIYKAFIKQNTLHFLLTEKIYNEFKTGVRTQKLMDYGPNFNENTCFIGHEVVLERISDEQETMKGIVSGFEKGAGWRDGNLIDVACITIKLDKYKKPSLVSKKIHNQNRAKDLMIVIKKCLNFNQQFPNEWLHELEQINNEN